MYQIRGLGLSSDCGEVSRRFESMISLLLTVFLQTDVVEIASKVTSNGEYALGALLAGSFTIIIALWRKLTKTQTDLQDMTKKLLEVTQSAIHHLESAEAMKERLTKILVMLEAGIIKINRNDGN